MYIYIHICINMYILKRRQNNLNNEQLPEILFLTTKIFTGSTLKEFENHIHETLNKQKFQLGLYKT